MVEVESKPSDRRGRDFGSLFELMRGRCRKGAAGDGEPAALEGVPDRVEAERLAGPRASDDDAHTVCETAHPGDQVALLDGQ